MFNSSLNADTSRCRLAIHNGIVMRYIFLAFVIAFLSGCAAPDPFSPTYNVPSQAVVDKYSDAAKKSRSFFQEGNYKESFHFAQISAEQGHADSQAHLGYLYRGGLGVEKNLNLAFNWYKKAAEQNQSHAEFNLAQMYRMGEGVEKNNELAKYWYKRAYDHNYGPEAKTKLNELSQ